MLGTELVPDQQPRFEAGLRMRVASGTIRCRVLKLRDEEKTLERHRQQFEQEQQRSDAIRRGAVCEAPGEPCSDCSDATTNTSSVAARGTGRGSSRV